MAPIGPAAQRVAQSLAPTLRKVGQEVGQVATEAATQAIAGLVTNGIEALASKAAGVFSRSRGAAEDGMPEARAPSSGMGVRSRVSIGARMAAMQASKTDVA